MANNKVAINKSSLSLSTKIDGNLTIMHKVVEELISSSPIKGKEELISKVFTQTYPSACKSMKLLCQRLEKGGVTPSLSKVLIDTYSSLREYVGEALVASGGTVLVVPDDYPMGNILPHILMELREQWGGQGDPRLKALKGYKIGQSEELCQLPSGNTEKQNLGYTKVQAEVFLNTLETLKEEEEEPTSAQLERKQQYEKAADELFKLMVDHNWLPLPMGSNIVLVQSNKTKRSNKTLETWLALAINAQLTIYGGKLKGDEIQPHAFEIMLAGESYVLPPFPEEGELNDYHFIKLHELNEWWGAYLCHISEKLDNVALCKIVEAMVLAKGKGKYLTMTPEKGLIKVTKGGETITFMLDKRLVLGRQKRQAFPKVIINGRSIESKFIILWLAIYACLKGNINALMNNLPNLWLREVNYGHQWELTHSTRLIRDTSALPISWKDGFDVPFGIKPKNLSFSAEILPQLVDKKDFRYSPYVDKNAGKLISNMGAAALTGIYYPEKAVSAFDQLDEGHHPVKVFKELFEGDSYYEALEKMLEEGLTPQFIVLEKYGLFCTANDGAKVTKFLNRAQQGGSWNECFTKLKFQKVEYTRKPSGLWIVLDPYKNPPPPLASSKEETQFMDWVMSLKP